MAWRCGLVFFLPPLPPTPYRYTCVPQVRRIGPQTRSRTPRGARANGTAPPAGLAMNGGNVVSSPKMTEAPVVKKILHFEFW
jgi:hypothetical protein